MDVFQSHHFVSKNVATLHVFNAKRLLALRLLLLFVLEATILEATI
jgi:hypothetical protein